MRRMDTRNVRANGLTSYPVILQTVTVVALFVSGFYVLGINPINNSLEKLNQEKLGISEHNEFKLRLDQQITLIRLQLEQDIRDLNAKMVPRPENESHWQNQNDRISILSERLNDLQKSFSGTYSIGDQIKNLQKQIEDLRAAVLSHSSPSSPLQGQTITPNVYLPGPGSPSAPATRQ